MNRQQRRQQAKLGMVNLRDITLPWQMSAEECETMLYLRLPQNVLETGHPFHHLTANGAIVEPDPTLEYYLGRLPADKQERIRTHWLEQVLPDAKKSVPVNRKYYGHDPFERH